MSDMTTIQVSKRVRDELAALGSKTDSFNSIIGRLLETTGAKK
jgi:predicted CopG family antitoxin